MLKEMSLTRLAPDQATVRSSHSDGAPALKPNPLTESAAKEMYGKSLEKNISGRIHQASRGTAPIES